MLLINASTLIFFASDGPSDQALIEKNLLRKVRAEEVGQLKKGEAFVKMVNSVFNMTTERVPDITQLGFADEIIAESRARYTTDASASGGSRLSTTCQQESTGSNKNIDTEGMASSIYGDSSSVNPLEKSFLECVYEEPALTITAIYKELSLSPYMGDKTKRALINADLIREVSTHLGAKSRIAKFLYITPRGFEVLGVSFGSSPSFLVMKNS
jgi:hypothetical protein